MNFSCLMVSKPMLDNIRWVSCWISCVCYVVAKTDKIPNSNSNKNLTFTNYFWLKWFFCCFCKFSPWIFPTLFYSLYYVSFALCVSVGVCFPSFSLCFFLVVVSFLSFLLVMTTTFNNNNNNKIKVTAADIKWKHINKKWYFKCVWWLWWWKWSLLDLQFRRELFFAPVFVLLSFFLLLKVPSCAICY